MKKSTFITSLLSVFTAVGVSAGDFYDKVVIEDPCNFYVQVTGGASFGVAGDFISEMAVDLSSHPVYSPLYTTVDANTNDLSFDDIYDAAASYGVRFGKVCDRTRIYLGFEYTEASGQNTEIGGITKDGDFCAVWADFSDYRDYALLLGFERDLGKDPEPYGKNPKAVMGERRLRPWVGGQLGLRFVDSIDATMRLYDPNGVLHPGSTVPGTDWFDDSVVFSAAFTFGVNYLLNDRVSIGVESGVRYQTGLDPVEEDLATAGFQESNDDGNILAVPVLGTVTIQF